MHSLLFTSVTQSCLTLRNPMNCSTPGLSVHHQLLEFSSNSCPLSWWCHPTILSLVLPFSSCLQSFPASGSFPVSQFFTSGGRSIGVSASASVLPVNIQDWFPLGLTGLISLQILYCTPSVGETCVFLYVSYHYVQQIWLQQKSLYEITSLKHSVKQFVATKLQCKILDSSLRSIFHEI